MSAPLKFELDRRQGVINIGYGAGSSPSFTNLTVTSTLTVGGSVHGANGSVGNPSFAFLSDQNTGLYRIGLNNIGVAANGSKVLDIATTGLTVTGALGASSLTAPASTDLTLAGGSSGASLVLGQGTGYAVATSTDTGTSGEQIALVASATTSGTPTAGYGPSLRFFRKGNDGGAAGSAASVRAVAIAGTGGSQYNSNLTLAARLAGNMVDVLTAKGDGTVSISSTTAGSSGAGALVVAGGLATGAASYFGGAATFTGDVSAQRLEAVDAAANNRAAAFFRTQNNTTYSSSVLDIQGDRTTTNATYNLINAQNAAVTGQFSVRDSGNAVNTNNSYGAISDRKLKENIVDATSKLEKLNQVRIVNFNRIGNEQKQLGVIAQELEQIFPSMIEEAIDRDAEGNDLGTTTKSVKYSVFVPMLIKAIQELTTRLAAVEAK